MCRIDKGVSFKHVEYLYGYVHAYETFEYYRVYLVTDSRVNDSRYEEKRNCEIKIHEHTSTNEKIEKSLCTRH